MSDSFNLLAEVRVNASKVLGPLPHNWNYIGTDECNYITEPEGEAVLAEFGRFSEKPYFVRPHHLFCTGNTRGDLKWGSTNVYTEDVQGNPVYDFKVLDQIFDTILNAGCKLFFELGFMPMDLADKSYLSDETHWGQYREYRQKGWACPPKDYDKWMDLISSVTQHLIERYGKEEVKTWYFELWNEPDLSYYWKGSPEEFNKLYDYTVAGIERVLPDAYIGGPSTTGPNQGGNSERFLDQFLNHCRSGRNYVTGETGTRLDFITFHVKGGGFPFNLRPEKAAPSVKSMVRQVDAGLDVIEKHGFKGLEIVLSEADPDGWAAGGMHDNINLYFRNTSYYASFAAASFHHMEQLAKRRGFDVRPLSWAFIFPGERCFEGTRAFQTQGIDKAIFNLFRLYAMLGEQQLFFESSVAADFNQKGEQIVRRNKPEINGFAALSSESIDILLYCHHDDWWNVKDGYQVSLKIEDIPFVGALKVSHYRIDADHSNACGLWEEFGRPYYPSCEQKEALKKKAVLTEYHAPKRLAESGSSVILRFTIPVNAISLIRVYPAEE